VTAPFRVDSSHRGPLPYRGLTDEELAIGVVTLRLVETWQAWIHRAVECVTLKHPSTFARSISFDYTLADGVAEDESLPAVVWADVDYPVHYVPLTMLRKRSLVNLDLRDEGGKALSLLTREQNSAVGTAVLRAFAERQTASTLSKKWRGSLPSDLQRELWAIASADAPEAVSAWERFAQVRTEPERAHEWRMVLRRDEGFMSFANDFARNFLVLVPVLGAAGQRRITKLSYDQYNAPSVVPVPRALRWLQAVWIGILAHPRGVRIRDGLGASHAGRPRTTRMRWAQEFVGWWPKRITIATPAMPRVDTYHLEFDAPEGLHVTRTVIQTRDRGWWDEENRSVLRSHVSVSRVRPGSVGSAVVNLRPRSETVVRAACITSAITTIVLTLTLYRWGAMVDNIGTVTGLLLFVPAALAGYVARSSESPATTEVLFGIRILTFGSAVWAFAAAAILVTGRDCNGAVPPSCDSWDATGWAIFTLLVLSSATLLCLLRTLTRTSVPPEQFAASDGVKTA
jgi:hypothetical protein